MKTHRFFAINPDPPPLRVRDPLPSRGVRDPPPLRVRDPRVRIDFEKKVDSLQIVFTFEGTPVFPRAGGSVFVVFLAHLEPFTPGAGGAIPPRRRLCVFLCFVCVHLEPFTPAPAAPFFFSLLFFL